MNLVLLFCFRDTGARLSEKTASPLMPKQLDWHQPQRLSFAEQRQPLVQVLVTTQAFLSMQASKQADDVRFTPLDFLLPMRAACPSKTTLSAKETKRKQDIDR